MDSDLSDVAVEVLADDDCVGVGGVVVGDLDELVWGELSLIDLSVGVGKGVDVISCECGGEEMPV